MRFDMFDIVARNSRHFPPLALAWGGQKSLAIAAPGVEGGRYLSFSLFLSLTLSAVALFALALAHVQAALPVALLSFASLSAFFLALPSMEQRRRTAELEAAMPFFLRSLGMLLGMGIPFQRALALACEGEGALEKEVRHVLRQTDMGMGLAKAMSALAMAHDSLAVKRAVSQLLSAYEIGCSGAELIRLGDELLSLEQHRMKEHSARCAMFGLLFMMTSAILPVFFLVYAVAGRFALSQQVEPGALALAMLVVFPLISALILLVSRALMPRSAFSGSKGLDAGLVAPGAIFVLGSLLPVSGFGGLPHLAEATMAAGAIAAAYLAYAGYGKEKALEEIDRHLPDALFSVSGMPRNAGPERVFEIIERGGHGALSVEAGKSRRQLAMNVKADAVLQDLWARNPSPMLRRACLMMKQMMATNSLDRMNVLADDMIRAFQAKRERSQMLALQKYTLLAGGLLVPLILRMTLGLLESIGSLLGSDGSRELLSCAASVIPPYLVIYATLASAAIADSEGRKSAAAMYFLAIAAAALAVFYFITL